VPEVLGSVPFFVALCGSSLVVQSQVYASSGIPKMSVRAWIVHVPGLILPVRVRKEDKEVATVMDGKLMRLALFLSVGFLGLGVAACGSRRLNVMSTPE
jgi:hypothetical protein